RSAGPDDARGVGPRGGRAGAGARRRSREHRVVSGARPQPGKASRDDLTELQQLHWGCARQGGLHGALPEMLTAPAMARAPAKLWASMLEKPWLFAMVRSPAMSPIETPASDKPVFRWMLTRPRFVVFGSRGATSLPTVSAGGEAKVL